MLSADSGPQACEHHLGGFWGWAIVTLLGTHQVPGALRVSCDWAPFPEHKAHQRNQAQETIPPSCAPQPLPRVCTQNGLTHTCAATTRLLAPETLSVHHILPQHPPLPAMPLAECHLLPNALPRWHQSSPGSEQVGFVLAWPPNPWGHGTGPVPRHCPGYGQSRGPRGAAFN